MHKDRYVGKVIHGYTITRVLANNLWGQLYLARSQQSEQFVVLKLLAAARFTSEQEEESFLQETKFLAEMQHPYMLPVLGSGIERGTPYLVLEYERHGSLRALLSRQRGRPLSVPMAYSILEQACDAISFLHQRHSLHGNLKPENILFSGLWQVLVADPSMVTITEALRNNGIIENQQANRISPYLAPEQLDGVGSLESDVYALGCIAYELLTGKAPFTTGKTSLEQSIRNEMPVSPRMLNPQLSMQLETLLMKAMAKNPEERYRDVRLFLQALRQVLPPAILQDALLEREGAGAAVKPDSALSATFLHRFMHSEVRIGSQTIPPISQLDSRSRTIQTHARRLFSKTWLLVCILAIIVLLNSIIFYSFVPHTSKFSGSTSAGQPTWSTTPPWYPYRTPTPHQGTKVVPGASPTTLGRAHPVPTPTVPIYSPPATPTPGTWPSPQPTKMPGQVLAYEPFNASPGPLHNLNDGTGWAGGWFVQNDDTSVPGYNVSSTAPPQLPYAHIATSGNYITGGVQYLTSGRTFDTSATGSFQNYLTPDGKIGQYGTSLYLSVLLRKEANNDQPIFVMLHNMSISWNTTMPVVAIGYFGSGSNAGGTRYWCLQVGNTIYNTYVNIIAGQTALLVLQLDFSSNSTARLYVNPSSLGFNAPPSPSAQVSGTNSLAFTKLAFYAGDDIYNGSLDEIRIGTSYAAVTPTS